MSELLNRADDLLQRLRVVSAGKNSDQVVGLTGADVDETDELIRDLCRAVKGTPQRRSKVGKSRGLTSRSKQRRKPDTAYKNFVRRHPCCVCTSRTNVEAHHAGAKKDKGKGMKAPDSKCIPLCGDCHTAAGDSFHAQSALPGMTPDKTRAFVLGVIAGLQAEWAAIQDPGML